MSLTKTTINEYRELLRPLFLEEFNEEIVDKRKGRPRIFTSSLTCVLMVMQVLEQESLSGIMNTLREGGLGEVLREFTGVEVPQLSLANGGFCRARQRLTIDAVTSVNNKIVQSGMSAMVKSERKIFNIDGTFFPLQNYPALVKEFGRTGNGKFQGTPDVLVVSAHDSESGLSLSPIIGSNEQSEQFLARQLMEQIPVGSLIVGDRNFGIFIVAFSAQQLKQQCLFRLTKSRYEKLKRDYSVTTSEQVINWMPSEHDLEKHDQIKPSDQVMGKLIKIDLRGFKESFYFFCTDINLSAKEIWEIYGKRQNIELDYRHLKCDLKKEPIKAKSVEMVKKEILITYATYNLLKMIIMRGSALLNVPMRKISFTAILKMITAQARGFFTMEFDPERYQKNFLSNIRYAVLPNRTKPRANEPRKVIRRHQKYQVMTKTRKQEQKALNKIKSL